MSILARWPQSHAEARAWLDALRVDGHMTISMERAEDLVAALEVRQMLTDCCKASAYPASGGSYVCGLRDGHDGDHASVWMQDSAEKVVRWSGATIRFDGKPAVTTGDCEAVAPAPAPPASNPESSSGSEPTA